MFDILISVGCLLITGVLSWYAGAKYEQRKNDEQLQMKRRLRKYLNNDTSIPRKWE